MGQRHTSAVLVHQSRRAVKQSRRERVAAGEAQPAPCEGPAGDQKLRLVGNLVHPLDGRWELLDRHGQPVALIDPRSLVQVQQSLVLVLRPESSQ